MTCAYIIYDGLVRGDPWMKNEKRMENNINPYINDTVLVPEHALR